MKNIKKFLKIKYILVFVAVAIVSIVVYNTKFKEKVITVKTVSLETQDVIKTVSASGGIESKASASLSFGATSKITFIYVEEGQLVSKGQLLATADSATQWQNSETAKFLKQQTIVDREQYIDNYADNLEAAGGREEYERQLRKKNDIVNQYDSSYKASASNLTDYKVYAPFTGTVVGIDKKVGEIATLGSTVIRLADLSSLYFESLIDQEDLGTLKNGQMAIVKLDSYPSIDFKGEVIEVPNYISKDSENIKIKIGITDTQQKDILYGMVGDSDIVVESQQTDTALPFQYVITDDAGRDFVWTINHQNRLEKKYVDLSLEGDLYYDLQTDLKGSKIVSIEDTKVTPEEGLKVNIVE
ncbi:efflux RND transporter periplasmic adaptor subunit [bacterium]|nr:efflux RND transporter periplasmic adaptor subunit [bacterium]